MFRILALLVSALLVGCATVPEAPDPAAKPGQAAIGIQVAIRPLLPLSSYAAEQVYFAKVGDSGEPVLETLYTSSYFSDGRAYALNVPPGRYAAVAGVFRQVGATYVSYFPQAMINDSIAVAREGEVAFAGRWLLDSAMGVCPEKADPVQLRVAEVVSPGVPKCGLLRMAIHDTLKQGFIVIGGSAFPLGPSTIHYAGVLREGRRDGDAAGDFRTAVGKDLQPHGWKAAETP